ncbi:hypothetical protein PRZ48_002592 [Zasmidium cellare]|uniref:Uncharacterized protein n=1 Tax=Zasmidium cellare TaxID=395010 RepID=A0ABR0ESP4_ZASCE|nr:hypothetical protein PRZ48_002592 [Zasmidium cellare]
MRQARKRGCSCPHRIERSRTSHTRERLYQTKQDLKIKAGKAKTIAALKAERLRAKLRARKAKLQAKSAHGKEKAVH